MKKFWLKIKELWISITKKSIDILKENAHIAVKVVNTIKSIVDGPYMDVIVALTTTNIDNAYLEKLRKILPEVATKLAITQEVLNSPTHEIINKLIEFLKSQNKDVRATFYIALAGKINEALSDGELSFSEAVSLAQIVYNEINSK